MMKLLQFKKTSLLVSAIFLSLTFTNNVYAQNLLWAKQISGTSQEYGRAVAVDATGNLFACGYYRGTVDFNPGVGTYTMTSSGDWDIYVTKTDASGNFVWAKSFGSPSASDDQAFTLTLDASSNVYTTGYFKNIADFDPGVGTFTLATTGNRDAFVSKLDANGDFVWARQLGGAGDDIGYNVSVDAAGNVYSCGYFSGSADFNPGVSTNTLTSVGSSDIYISKLDVNGNFVWAKNIGSTSGDVATCLTQDATGNIYVGGTFQGTTDFDPNATTFTVAAAGSGDAFIVKLDAAGTFGWVKTMGGTGYDRISSIKLDASNNIYTTGYFVSTADFDPSAASYTMTSAGTEDVFVSKLDALGNFVWAKKMGGINSEDVSSIDVDAAGNVYTIGEFNGLVDFDPNTGTSNLTSNTGSYDVFISKLDASGNYMWAKSIGGVNDDFGYGLTLDATGDLFATGYFSGIVDFDPNGGVFNLSSNANSIDAFIIRLGSLTTDINYLNTVNNISLYPNPATTMVTIQTEETIVSISIYNTLGALVQQEKETSFSVEHLPAGVYLLKTQTAKGTNVTRFVKD